MTQDQALDIEIDRLNKELEDFCHKMREKYAVDAIQILASATHGDKVTNNRVGLGNRFTRLGLARVYVLMEEDELSN